MSASSISVSTRACAFASSSVTGSVVGGVISLNAVMFGARGSGFGGRKRVLPRKRGWIDRFFVSRSVGNYGIVIILAPFSRLSIFDAILQLVDHWNGQAKKENFSVQPDRRAACN